MPDATPVPKRPECAPRTAPAASPPAIDPTIPFVLKFVTMFDVAANAPAQPPKRKECDIIVRSVAESGTSACFGLLTHAALMAP